MMLACVWWIFPLLTVQFSGHVALPGGHQGREDAGAYECAVREVHEEIGINVDRDGTLGLAQHGPAQFNVVGRELWCNYNRNVSSHPRLAQPSLVWLPGCD